jgi:hypothetical protein
MEHNEADDSGFSTREQVAVRLTWAHGLQAHGFFNETVQFRHGFDRFPADPFMVADGLLNFVAKIFDQLGPLSELVEALCKYLNCYQYH